MLPKPYYENELGRLYHGDCLDILPHLEPVDLVLTDPPYGCGKDSWDISFPKEWFRQCLTKTSGFGIITGSSGLKDSVPLVGDLFVDVISARNLNGMTRGPIGFGNWLAVVVAKRKPRQGPNFLSFSVRGNMPEHPSPKPIEFMLLITDRLSENGETILDPFLGSGTTAVSCERLKRRWIGIEIEEKYCAIAVKRIEAERKQLKLF